MCAHGTLANGLNDVREHDRIEAEIRESLQLARKNQIPNLICFSGNRVAGQSDADAVRACAKGLRRVAALAEEAGVNLNMELLNSRIDHPGYQADRTSWGVEVCKEVKSPRVKLLYDIYHMQIMEGDVIRTIRDNIKWIGHVHTAGNPGRNDLDHEQELYYPAICRALDAAGYTGFVAHEFTPKGLDRLDALAEAFAVCNVGAPSASAH
jgi:hydroxypyruvate isomerase